MCGIRALFCCWRCFGVSRIRATNSILRSYAICSRGTAVHQPHEFRDRLATRSIANDSKITGRNTDTDTDNTGEEGAKNEWKRKTDENIYHTNTQQENEREMERKQTRERTHTHN